MATGDNDQEALSKLLQIGTVAEYESEFVKLANRVTGISQSLLKSFYISGLKLDLQCLLLRSNPKTLDEAFSLARAVETRFANLDIWEFLRSNPFTLGEDFFKARITEDIVEKKIDVVVPLEGEFASLKAEESLNGDEYIGTKDVVGGGEIIGVGENKLNRVLDEIKLSLIKELAIKVLKGRDVSGESLVVCLKYVSCEKSRRETEDGRRVLCYVRRKKKTTDAAI